MVTTDLEGTIDTYTSFVRDLKYYNTRIQIITFDAVTGVWAVMLTSSIMPGMVLTHLYELPIDEPEGT